MGRKKDIEVDPPNSKKVSNRWLKKEREKKKKEKGKTSQVLKEY